MSSVYHRDVVPAGVRTFCLDAGTPLHEVRRRLTHSVLIYDTLIWRNITIQRLPFHKYRLTVTSPTRSATRTISGLDAAHALTTLLAELSDTQKSPEALTQGPVKRPRLGHGFRGVTKEGHRWRATVFLGWIGGRRGRRNEVYVGKFDTPEQAARAYDRYVVEHGLDKPLNFPQEPQP